MWYNKVDLPVELRHIGGIIYEKRKHKHKYFNTHKMGLQASHSVCVKVQKKGILLIKKIRNTRDIEII